MSKSGINLAFNSNHKDILSTIIIASMVYLLRIFSGREFDSKFIANSEIMQSLGRQELLESPLFFLSQLHTQPPLLNAIFAIALRFSPYEEVFVQSVWFLIAILLVATLTYGMRTIINSWKVRTAVATLFILSPQTLSYAFWSYNTLLVQCFSLLCMVSSINILKKIHVRTSIAVLCSSSFILFLLRVPFFWFIVLVIIFFHFSFAIKQKLITIKSDKVLLAGVLLTCSMTVAVQTYYFTNFGLKGLSSWSSDQTLSVLKRGLNTEELAKISNVSSCFDQILKSGPWNSISAYSTCEVDRPIFFNEVKLNRAQSANNLLSPEKLLGSLAVEPLVRYIILNHPAAMFRAVFGNDEWRGTFSTALGMRNVEVFNLFYLIYYNWIQIMLVLSINLLIFLFFSKRVRRRFPDFRRELALLTWLCIVSAYMFTYALLGEQVENERIKADGNAAQFFTLMFSLSISLKIISNLHLRVKKLM